MGQWCYCLMATTYTVGFNDTDPVWADNVPIVDGAGPLNCGLFAVKSAAYGGSGEVANYNSVCDHTSMFSLQVAGSTGAAQTTTAAAFPDLPAEDDGTTQMECSCRIADADAFETRLRSIKQFGYNMSGFVGTNKQCDVAIPVEEGDGYYFTGGQYVTGFTVEIRGYRSGGESVLPYDAVTCFARVSQSNTPLGAGDVFEQTFFINPAAARAGAALAALLASALAAGVL